jgi:hypothetical protein
MKKVDYIIKRSFVLTIMKLIMGLIMIITFLSCKKENSVPEPSISQEIAKIETKYKEGDIKIETFLLPGESKVESRASNDYLSKILKRHELSGIKQKAPSKSSDRVGVIKEIGQSCGSYDELEITMDCEDSRNATHAYNWYGDNYVNGNVTLRFCLVPKSAFQSSKYFQYAVLSLDYGWVHMIERYFDNEDGTSINAVKLNGTTLSDDEIYALGGGISEDGNYNMTLCFTVYEQDPTNGAEDFPDLSISYGVFGYFQVPNSAAARGRIHTDDEDTGNDNLEWYNWNLVYSSSDPEWDDVHDIIEPTEGGANTNLWMSRVKLY